MNDMAPFVLGGVAVRAMPFAFDGKETVRVIVRGGSPWFLAADVCRALGIKNPTDATEKLDEDEKAAAPSSTLGSSEGGPARLVVSESGLYTLILRCRDATTAGSVPHRFRKWVTAEVLPAIRRDGGYMVAAPEETPEALALRALTVLQATVERQKAQLEEAAPKAEALDRLSGADGSLGVTAAAKALCIRPKDLFGYLRHHGWIYKRAGGSAYLGYQTRVAAGLLDHKVTTVLRADGSEKVVEQVLVTPKGLAKLATLIKPALTVVP